MKTKQNQLKEDHIAARTISLDRAREIMKEEGIEYTDEELNEILEFISKVISISTHHYERIKQKQAKVISINANNSTHETESIPIHPSKHRRAS